MRARRSWGLPLVILGGVGAAMPLRAEEISIAGSVLARVQEFVSGQSGRTDEGTLSFPGSSTTLPLQVAAQLLVLAEPPAAGAAAAQFADPNTQPVQANPQEFALNMALLSVSDAIRYTGTALSQEVRTIVFTTREYPFHRSGDTISLTGRFYVDGAVALLSPDATRDLTGASVYLRVTVVKQVTGRDDETVFSGRVGLVGGSAASAQPVVEGAFPTSRVLRTNLGALVPEFALFEVLIVPNLRIDYSYRATVGETFSLVATVEVEGTNVANQTGVLAIVGTPVTAIRNVIAAAQGDGTATKTINALQTERDNPTGTAAFPQTSPRTVLPMCGLFGFEFVLGTAALAAVRPATRWRRARLVRSR